jgi:hypothetical protein
VPIDGSRESARLLTINGLILSAKTRPNALSRHRLPAVMK